MSTDDIARWRHEHTFGQDRKRPGETRTVVVIALTALTMVVEITAGVLFGSMALLADGLHMASHAAALTITAFAYIYARRHAHDTKLSFGAGKANALGGFSGALLLAVFALIMVWESTARLIDPITIRFDQAIGVAVLGLLVNGASVLVLGNGHEHEHDPHHHHDHGSHHHHHDHNLRAAYLHVLADALTSVLAIFALLAGKYLALHWMDPLMGLVGAALVARWSVGLLRTTSSVLLDRQAPAPLLDAVRAALEHDADDRVSDLHVWSIGPGIYSLAATVVSNAPECADHYKQRIPSHLGIVHHTIEVHTALPSNGDDTAERRSPQRPSPPEHLGPPAPSA